MKDLKCKIWSQKIPKKTQGKKSSCYWSLAINFWIWHQKHKQQKLKKKCPVRLCQTKSFCIGKEMINQRKRQTMEWEKIFTNPIPDKRFISNIHKKLTQLNSKNKNKNQIIQLRNRQRNWTDILKDIQMANRSMIRCSASLISGIKINAIVKYHLIPIKMAVVIIRKTNNNKCCWGCGEKEILVHCYCKCKLV